MKVLFLTIQILSSIIGLAIGLFVFLKPKITIELQRRFYEKINWKIEPISMQKEIRNTKIMGLFLTAIVLLTIVYIFYCWLRPAG